MKRWLILAAGSGLALAIAIIAYQGFGAVAQAFAAVGFGLAAVIVLRAVELAGAGLGWWIVFPAAGRCPLYACVWVRFIREAINALLPVAQVGGEIAAVRVMTFFSVAGELAGATVLVDILLQALTLLLFTIVGIGALATVVADRALVGSLVAGTAMMALALTGFFAAQRFGGARLFDRFLMALAANSAGPRSPIGQACTIIWCASTPICRGWPPRYWFIFASGSSALWKCWWRSA